MTGQRRGTDRATIDKMTAELNEFQQILSAEGLHPALRFVNLRTPHRFTGVYRYDGEMLRNLAMYDKFTPGLLRGDDAPLAQTFCANVQGAGGTLEVLDGSSDERFPWMATSPVISYCGVEISDIDGRPFGTLCHFDTQRCQQRVSDIPLLTAAAPLIWQALRQTA